MNFKNLTKGKVPFVIMFLVKRCLRSSPKACNIFLTFQNQVIQVRGKKAQKHKTSAKKKREQLHHFFQTVLLIFLHIVPSSERHALLFSEQNLREIRMNAGLHGISQPCKVLELVQRSNISFPLVLHE